MTKTDRQRRAILAALQDPATRYRRLGHVKVVRDSRVIGGGNRKAVVHHVRGERATHVSLKTLLAVEKKDSIEKSGLGRNPSSRIMVRARTKRASSHERCIGLQPRR